VLGEVFMQQRKGKLIELAARPNRPPWAAGFPGLNADLGSFLNGIRRF